MSDEVQLLEAWRAGDQAAGGTLLERHYESVLRFFRTKAGEDADDLTQRTFLRCVEGTTSFRGESTFKAFVFGIARNVLLEYIRSRRRDAAVDPDFGASSILDLNPRASTVVFSRAEQRMLVQALQRMPLELQMTLELYYWEELSVEEVAAVVGQAPGTVKSRLHRGRTLLRETFEQLAQGSQQTLESALTAARLEPAAAADKSVRGA